MRAIFIAVGSELLEQNRLDTNSLYISKKLQEKGILMDMKWVVGDDLTNLEWAVKNAHKRAQILIITGGLGPTEDDLTREAVANALRLQLEFREDIVDNIKERFRRRGLDMPQNNARQAFVIKGAEVLANEVGTAPGLYLDDEQCRVLMLPGVPQEMKPMFDKALEEKIAPLSNFIIYKRLLKFGNITESGLDSLIAEYYIKFKNPKTTILASPGLIEVHLLGRSRKSMEEAQEPTDELAEIIKEKLKDHLVTEKDITLEEYILDELRTRGLTLSTAESCTGGGIGSSITDVPGSSDAFLGGVVAYSNEMKMKLLGVEEETLIEHGAVSRETAREMARGVRELTGSDIGVAVTGIAGPGGGTPDKSVGLVFMHVSGHGIDIGQYRNFPGDRALVKKRTGNYALYLVKEYLEVSGNLDNPG